MTLPSFDELIGVIYRPTESGGLSPVQWDRVIRQGRRSNLLAHVGAAAQYNHCWHLVPAGPRMHIESALNLATRQQRELRWEVQQITKALQPTGVTFVLLKGAAYVMADLKAAKGRTVSDVDILVPRDALPAIESALMMAGWVSTTKSAYDQHYYRTWMHELPPMRHIKRGTTIDVHHAILPIMANIHPSSEKLLANARSLDSENCAKVLAPVDMLLHSATHLFHEGEFEQGLRGLIDIDRLLTEFGSQSFFWSDLVPRAIELELTRPLFYALRYTRMVLKTSVPDAVVEALQQTSGGRLSVAGRLLMDALFLRALRPPHASASDAFTPMARGFLYMRGHWLRMPFWLLVRHLARKLILYTKKTD